ncbi:unnamed protein product [Cylindrotheca closterium]|uniref:Uncharacterized protein n=1 Tax=Cylindrotheca closterium TaxID=2856 RepID=A0AAD2CZ34_9STRA|nr:unnamed protein product [Cylindrotheca closterium]
MSENLLNSKGDWAGDAQALQGKESAASLVPSPATQSQQAGQAGAPVPPQGRRVTIGGANRRSSLGFDQINDALFGRRPSGFGELDNLFGRRGSMDSTAAAFDAHIMDLTRRRLSMAGGTNDPLASFDPLGGMGGVNLNLGNVASINSFGQLPSMSGGNPPNSNNGAASAAALGQDATSLNNRQQQLQEQQHDLERKQKELELQRQQLLAAMGERRLAIQSMHHNMNGPQNNTQQAQQAQRNALNFNNAQGLLMGLQNQGFAAAAAATNSAPDVNGGGQQQQWFVCRVCNGKAFNNREEANAHENMCMMNNAGAAAARRNSLAGMMRRGSLDLLGSLAGGPLANQTPDIFAAVQGFQPQLSMSVANQTSKQNNDDAFVSEHMSNGPFAAMNKPIPLAMETDKEWLTPLHCFVRKHCVEVFTAVEEDVATPSKGKRKPIQVGQVGIRCPHCHRDPLSQSKERGSIYYPTSIASIYNATMNLLQRHLHNCNAVPPEIMERYEMLKGDDARSGTSKKYWVQSAVSLGLVDTGTGIRYSGVPQPNALPQIPALEAGNMFKPNEEPVKHDEAAESSSEAETATDSKPAAEQKRDNTIMEPASPESPIVVPEDEPCGTAFSYYLLQQMRPCVFAEADRLGKRKGLPPGFPGLACKHCFGGYGSGRFFPSSIKTLSDTSKTLNVLHNHMMRCRKVPPEIRDSLTSLRKTHDEERAKMKFGSQKAFFARIWDRLHFKDPSVSSKRKFQPARVQPQIPAQAPQAVSGFLPSNFLGQPGFNMNQVNMLEALNNMQTMQQFNAAAAGDITDSNKRHKA